MIAKLISFFANGYNLATALKSFSAGAEVDELDSTVLASAGAYRSYVPGMKSGSLSAEGVWNADTTDADEIDDVLKAAFANGTELVITASMESLAVGGVAILLDACEKSYKVTPELAQLIMVSADFSSRNGVNFGVWLFNAAVDNTTLNGTSIDNGAASSNGGLFHVHWQNPDEFETQVILQHSSNNSTWVDLAEGEGNDAYQGISATITGTVNRYVRAVVTTTAGSVTVQAAFARR